MSGYAASGRIVRSAPRLARGGSTGPGRQAEPGPTAPVEMELVDTIRGELVEPTETDDGRLAAIRERWAQMTFFLFDANAWRS